MGGSKPVQTRTIITPKVGAFSDATGHLAVKVTNRDNLGQLGVTVYLRDSAGTLVDTLVTNGSGCAFFAYKAAGSYSVTSTRRDSSTTRD